jgi:2Fe-2S ferredoxin
MISVTYITHSGQSYEIKGDEGATLMEVAMRNGVPGIDAECGGACSCATCHVYVDAVWAPLLPPAQPMEEDMLDFASDVRPTSRLSCQIRLKHEYDGLVVYVPERQG